MHEPNRSINDTTVVYFYLYSSSSSLSVSLIIESVVRASFVVKEVHDRAFSWAFVHTLWSRVRARDLLSVPSSHREGFFFSSCICYTYEYIREGSESAAGYPQLAVNCRAQKPTTRRFAFLASSRSSRVRLQLDPDSRSRGSPRGRWSFCLLFLRATCHAHGHQSLSTLALNTTQAMYFCRVFWSIMQK